MVATAGGTREPIDPVRFVSNRSSGKMGYAVAEAARDRGAAVTLVAAPTSLPDPVGVAVVRVESAIEMRDALIRECRGRSISWSWPPPWPTGGPPRSRSEKTQEGLRRRPLPGVDAEPPTWWPASPPRGWSR